MAIGLALKHLEKVPRLVLTATSGGIDVRSRGATEWLEDYRKAAVHAVRTGIS